MAGLGLQNLSLAPVKPKALNPEPDTPVGSRPVKPQTPKQILNLLPPPPPTSSELQVGCRVVGLKV